jgi:sec-independent protein translocase protein TatA
MGLSPMEIAVILIVVVLLFGAKRLPELGSGMGKAISNFKRAFNEGTAIDVTPKTEEKKAEGRKEEKPGGQEGPKSA